MPCGDVSNIKRGSLGILIFNSLTNLMHMPNIEPLHDKVVIKPLSQEEVTASGIVLPDTVDKEKPMEGEVVAAGDGKILDNGKVRPLEIKVGDRVFFRKYAGTEIKINDEVVAFTRADESRDDQGIETWHYRSAERGILIEMKLRETASGAEYTNYTGTIAIIEPPRTAKMGIEGDCGV